MQLIIAKFKNELGTLPLKLKTFYVLHEMAMDE